MRWREEGERSLLFTWPALEGAELRRAILSLQDAILAARPAWLVESVPALASLLVVHDPLEVGPREAAAWVEERAAARAPARESREVEVPVKYGGPEGLDLERVAAAVGLSSLEVIRRHAAAEYRVAFLGFSPGFPYLEGLPAELAVPRLATPRIRVPAGSVALAGRLAGIYPRESPGGWNVIGRTSLELCDLSRPEPFLLGPGDRVRFRPVPALPAPAPPEAAPPPAAAPPPEGPPAEGRRPLVARLEAPGLLTTIQDLGRPGRAHLGVPPSGAMDRLALRLANLAVGNPRSAPALEFTFPGPRLRFLEPARFALAGADLGARLRGGAVPLHRALEARPGDELRFEERRAGVWGYLALAGGIAAPRVLGSASSDLRSGLLGRLAAGARLEAEGAPPPGGPLRVLDSAGAPRDLAPLPEEGAEVRYVPPGESEGALPLPELDGVRVRLSLVRDRSGYQSEGPVLVSQEGTLPSEGIAPGTIQLPPDGRLIFLMADRPTTGGYRKAGFVAGVDLRRVAQLPAGATLRLRKTTAAGARRLLREEEALLASAGLAALGN